MNILSLFDGISCGRVAAERAGLQVDNYYASEIDPNAILISKKNYPDINQLGDVRQVQGEGLEKIDLLMGGSPCQGFSIAGKMLNFQDPRSELFFEFVRVLEEIKPKYFLLENVYMKQAWQDIISDYLGQAPVRINSSLVSAQYRDRLYWSNIPLPYGLPLDKGIVLKNIVEETDPGEAYHMSKLSEAQLITVNEPLIKMHNAYYNKSYRVVSLDGKSCTLDTAQGGGRSPYIPLPGGGYRKLTPLESERLQTLPDNYTAGLCDRKRYGCIGNAWTVDIIAWILRGLTL